ncbi:DNRLRE domain-containing protein [Sorangium sp. So ce1128]
MNRVPIAASLAAIVASIAGCGATSGDTGAGEQVATVQQGLSTDGQVCLTIDQAANVADATLWQAAPRWNDGQSAHLHTGASSSGGPSRALLRHDLSAVPASATVVSASLSVYQLYKTTASTINVHRVTAPWSEEWVTWSSFGSSFDPAVTASFSAPGGGSLGFRTVDVGALAQAWLDGELANHGVLLDDPSRTKTDYRSSESPNAAQRPRLELCYVTCDDGVQNGEETGIDCGGSRCSPCPSGPGCEPAGTPLSFSIEPLDLFVDGTMLATDGVNVFAAAASSSRIYTIDPESFSVTSFVSGPLLGNNALSVDPATGDFFFSHAPCGEVCPRYRLSESGAVELGPFELHKEVFTHAWDPAAGELHLARFGAGGGDVLVTDRDFNVLGSYGAEELTLPVSIAIDSASDRIVIGDIAPARIYLFDRATRALLSVIDGASAGAPFSIPHGLAVSGAGVIWVVDRENDRVLGFQSDGSLVQELTGFDDPVSAVYHDATGCLFVAEWNHATWGGPSSRLHRFCGCP